MHHLYRLSDFQAIIARINHLKPDSERLWGEMTPARMLAHTSAFLNTVMGNYFPKRRVTDEAQSLAYKKALVNDEPMPRDIPTDTEYRIDDDRDFETEKTRALHMLHQFFEDGPERCTTHPHPAFGRLSPEEWATFLWKHYDHHLRQFGV